MKYKQLLAQLEKETAHIDLIYFFDQTKNEMEQLLNAKGFSDVTLVRAQDFSPTTHQQALVIEVYPLKSTSDQLIDLFEPQTEIQFWVGLDESILKMFGQEKLISLMQKLGVKEDEAIEHSMIGKSIRRAQEKLESDLSYPKDIRTSLDDWEAENRVVEG